MLNKDLDAAIVDSKKKLVGVDFDIKKLCIDLKYKSEELKKVRILEQIEEIVLPMIAMKDGMDVKFKKPNTLVLLKELNTKANKLRDSVRKIDPTITGEFDLYMDPKARKIVKTKFKNKLKDISRTMDGFEIEIRLMFDVLESLMNAYCFIYDRHDTFNNTLYLANKNNIITNSEYNSLKAFNALRNMLAHNMTTNVIIDILKSDNISLYGSIIDAASDVLEDTVKRHLGRLVFYTAYHKVHISKDATDEQKESLLRITDSLKSDEAYYGIGSDVSVDILIDEHERLSKQ